MYVIDSSALFNLRHYPGHVSVFKPIWTSLSTLARTGALIAPREVLRETNGGMDADPVKLWAQVNEHMFYDIDEEQAAIVREIWSKLGMNDYGTTKPHRADKWCVALAVVKKRKGLKVIVVTDEGKKPMGIPAICRAFHIKSISLFDFFKKEVKLSLP